MSCYALVPAAGGGSRMSAGRPKQYLPLAGRPLLYHALATLCAAPAIAGVYVVLAPDDSYWQDADYADLSPKLRVLRCGGATRALSVVNGLRAMVGDLAESDWLLVHDAARACLTVAHVETLIDEVADDPVGGLLAVPVADTLKRDERGRIAATVPRENLWQAQTPQMFRYGLLRDALEFAPAVTDEAGAIEALGLHPKLVAGDTTNFKITYPLDLGLAEAILQHRRRHGE